MFSSSRRFLPAACKWLSIIKDSNAIQTRNVWDLRPFPLSNILRDFDRFERDFFRNSPLRILAPRLIPIDGSEMKNDTYRINIDVSGFKPEDIKISLKQNVVTIKAKMDTTAEDGSRFQQEILREFNLPDGIDQSTLKSLLHSDGILSVEASLTKPEEPKEIPIEMPKN